MCHHLGFLQENVAPLVGAWIEINSILKRRRIKVVAPLVGAWIEIEVNSISANASFVAPLVGAWIEI